MEMTVLRRSVLLVLLTAACAIATQANHVNHVNLAKHANHANHANPAHRAKRANYVNHANLANRANQVVRGPARMPLLIGQTAERPVAARQPIEVHPRDGQHKEKFIRHLTGPLYFNPKCRKHFYRLYHNTRDCTVPTYYRRCALLLTRLAGTPRCSER